VSQLRDLVAPGEDPGQPAVRLDRLPHKVEEVRREDPVGDLGIDELVFIDRDQDSAIANL